MKNISAKYPIKINSVNIYGSDIKINVPKFTILNPGESADFEIKGELENISLTTIDIALNYTIYGSLTPVGCRTITFMIDNGDAAEYKNSYTAASVETPFDRLLTETLSIILKKAGVLELIKMLYNYYVGLIYTFSVC